MSVMAIDYIGSETGLLPGLIEPTSAASYERFTYVNGWNTSANLSKVAVTPKKVNNVTVISSSDINTSFANSKVPALTKNIPKTKLMWQILFDQSTRGTPMIKFTGTKGPKTMIVAGMHGNEISSQVAALRLIDYLSKNTTKIKGTIIIIPMLSPKATLAASRTIGSADQNRVAYKVGISGTLVKVATEKEKVSALGDFHTTRPGGIPGKSVILASAYSKSIAMAKYMAKYTKHSYDGKLLKKPLYKGALSNVLNSKKVSAVIAEVKSVAGTVSPGSDTASYKQMTAFLKYTKNL